ncbi:hypothetical protein Mycsm_04031 [Mycobacterium sp. JS623]|nr:hypothetical protein Mycsm_04031 [Mycobacterium sp. JS623]
MAMREPFTRPIRQPTIKPTGYSEVQEFRTRAQIRLGLYVTLLHQHGEAPDAMIDRSARTFGGRVPIFARSHERNHRTPAGDRIPVINSTRTGLQQTLDFG